MNSETLTAIAAIAAAVISLMNIFLTAFFARHQEGRKWVRELMPELIGQFADAAFQHERIIFQTDWTELSEVEQSELGMEEFRKANALREKLETFANPATISAARNLLNSVDAIRFASFDALESGDFAIWHPRRRKCYWAFVEAQHKFMVVARKEMGLKSPPTPPGLVNYRKAVKTKKKLKIAEEDETNTGHTGL
jgi:hypothetical protein